MRVLIVEDEPAIRHLLDIALTRNGHLVLLAPSADEAAALLLDFPEAPHVAVLDIVLPGTDGITFSDVLLIQFPEIRFVFITGYGERDPRVMAAVSRGAVVSKPFHIRDIVRAIEIAAS